MDNKGEPPSGTARPPLFRVGRDSHGRWVVQEQSGLRGGLFVGRAEALKYAMFENGNRPQADAWHRTRKRPRASSAS